MKDGSSDTYVLGKDLYLMINGRHFGNRPGNLILSGSDPKDTEIFVKNPRARFMVIDRGTNRYNMFDGSRASGMSLRSNPNHMILMKIALA
jgi:hypothetical protein